MTVYSSSQDRDANRQVVSANEAFRASKTVAFTGAAGLGAQGTVSLFTVTGDVIVNIFGVCTEDLAGATATIEVGVSGLTTVFIAQTTATNIDTGEVWVDNVPATVEPVPTTRIITAGQDVIATVATADITDGTMVFYCLWRPLSSDGNVTAA